MKRILALMPDQIHKAHPTTGDTALHIAVRHYDANLVGILCSAGARVNARNLTQNTPLHLSLSERAVHILLEKGADVHAVNSDGRQPIHSVPNDVDILRLLLDAGADVNAADRTRVRPLHRAAKWGDGTTARFLLQRGADVCATDSRGWTALDEALYRMTHSLVPGPAVGVLEALLDAGANTLHNSSSVHLIGWLTTDLRRPLQLLIESSLVDLRLLEATLTVGRLPMLTNPTTLSVLLRYGLDENARDERGRTLFARILYAAGRHCACLMLLRGVDLSVCSPPGGPTHALLLSAFPPASDLDLAAPLPRLRQQCRRILDSGAQSSLTEGLVAQKLP